MFKNITEKKELKDYIIPETNITIEAIYENLKIISISSKNISEPLEYNINGYKLKINKNDLNYFYLELEGNDIPFLLTPIK